MTRQAAFTRTLREQMTFRCWCLQAQQNSFGAVQRRGGGAGRPARLIDSSLVGGPFSRRGLNPVRTDPEAAGMASIGIPLPIYGDWGMT